MQVQINGEAHDIDGGLTVAGLVERLQLDVRKIAVERNREIVSRSAYGSVALTEGDALEIVGFVGGG